jgi:hypothetical protein
MKLHHWMAIALTLWTLGCQTTPPPATQPAPMGATAEQIQAMRAAYKAQNPAIEVGVVEDTLPSENRAQVSDVDASKFKEGNTVCFVDGSGSPLVCGSIVAITNGHLHVKYEQPSEGHRAPMKGDIAVAYP